jgi:hypothetical protein
MKSLFITLLILGGAFLAYDYFVAEPGTKIVFKSLNPPPKAKVVKSATPEPEVKVPEAAPTPVVEAPRPVVTASAPPPSAPTPAPAPAAPKSDSIEVLTGNWMKIPPSAFPREVKLLQDAEFKMSVGSSKVLAGSKAYAVGASQGILTLAPTATSPARAQMPIDSTDLKPQLTAIYEAWKIKRAEELAANALRRQQLASQPVVAASASEVEPDGKPVRASDGSYPLLLASIKNGQVTEIKPENIQGWQDPQTTVVEGKPAWAVKVNFQANTVFGLYPAEAQALVVNGKVKGWYYTGSGEEVP